MTITKKIVFAALFSLGTLSAAFAQYDPNALEILEAMSKKYKAIPSFEANLTSTLVNESEGIKEEFKGKITVKGEKFKLELEDQVIINNGTTVWTYIPSANEVTIDNFDPKSDDINPIKIFDIYKKGFKYLYLGDKLEPGNDEVDLVPEKKNAQYFKIKMMISKKDRSIQSWTMYDKSGNRYKYIITKFVPNAKADDAFFSFDAKKYPGVQSTDLR